MGTQAAHSPNHGHLSNHQSARLLSMALGSRLKHIVLAHLSDENNTPELARQAIEQVIGDRDVEVTVGRQLSAMGPYEVSQLCATLSSDFFSHERTHHHHEVLDFSGTGSQEGCFSFK